MTNVPDVLPMLARGKHRNPRRGACFMELASHLAGEPWSDSPACTDPALAHVARLVNDFTEDRDRPLLAPLIPSVIGLADLGTGFGDDVALLAASHALPVAPEERQRGLAVGVLRTLGSLDAYRTSADPAIRSRAREVLASQRSAERWARAFAARLGPTHTTRSSADVITEIAVRGLAEACVPDPAARLRDLLAEVIAHARTLAPTTEPAPLDPAQWLPRVRAAS